MDITIYKDGIVATRINSIQVQADKRLLEPRSGRYFVNKTACIRLGLDPIKVVEAGKNGKYPVEAYLRMGENEGGTRVIDRREEKTETDDQYWTRRKLELNAVLLGLGDITELQKRISEMDDRYDDAFQHMMDTGSSVMPGNISRAPQSLRDELYALHAQYPAVGIYQQGERQLTKAGAIGSDNSGAGEAGRKAMQIILEGGDLETARAALAERNAFFD